MCVRERGCECWCVLRIDCIDRIEVYYEVKIYFLLTYFC